MTSSACASIETQGQPREPAEQQPVEFHRRQWRLRQPVGFGLDERLERQSRCPEGHRRPQRLGIQQLERQRRRQQFVRSGWRAGSGQQHRLFSDAAQRPAELRGFTCVDGADTATASNRPPLILCFAFTVVPSETTQNHAERTQRVLKLGLAAFVCDPGLQPFNGRLVPFSHGAICNTCSRIRHARGLLACDLRAAPEIFEIA